MCSIIASLAISLGSLVVPWAEAGFENAPASKKNAQMRQTLKNFEFKIEPLAIYNEVFYLKFLCRKLRSKT
jgi:hypothetical protein